MTVRNYLEPVQLLCDLVETHKDFGLVDSINNNQDLIQSVDFQQLLTHLRQIQNAGEKEQFIQFVQMIFAD